jgi:protein ImuB
VRDVAEERFEEHLSLEWPIEGLEPLSFVLARLLDPLCHHLERRDRGAVGLRLWLKLVTRSLFTRYLPLPVPMRDPKGLRTLLVLDLESHPPPAGIDEITLTCDVAPGRILQHSLLTRPLPSPDRVSTLVARLTALMGEGRCGHPVVPDTHRPDSFKMRAFAPEAAEAHERLPGADGQKSPVRVADEGEDRRWQGQPSAMLRRFRRPVVAQVAVRDERPVRVSAPAAGVRGGRVRQSAGPWRTSGGWWEPAAAARDRGAWDRDEWDVALEDRVVYRLSRHRPTGTWVVEGYWD